MTDNLTGTTLRTSLALLTALVLLNSACAIVSYSPTEPVVKPLIEIHDKRELLSFSIAWGLPYDGVLIGSKNEPRYTVGL